MCNQTVLEAIQKLYCSLDLKRKIIGVKFLFSEEEYLKADAKALVKGLHYCVMVKSAMSGKSIKANINGFKCNASSKALGIAIPDESCLSGRHFMNLGLYQDLTIAKSVRNDITYCSHRAYGVLLKPLDEFIETPDVVIMMTTPSNAMRMIQGYSYRFGTQKCFKMVGSQALCSECTAYPYEKNDINVSMLCSGTRFFAKWEKEELGIGIPFNKFVDTAEGVFQTINATETKSEKLLIAKKLHENNISSMKINFNRNYYHTIHTKEGDSPPNKL